MDKIDITTRVRELNDASEAYYNTGCPIMSDAEFDMKLRELQQWEDETGFVLSNSPTQNVGATVLNNIKEVTHKYPMLSLDKCHSEEEIIKFADGYNFLVSSVKLDGLTVRLTYKNGNLTLAESRGNGIVGSDVTEHVKRFKNVPLHINHEGTYIIDGEAIIKLDDFAEVNKNGEYKNSRNLASGTLASLDTSIVKNRKLSWYAWEVVEDSEEETYDYDPTFLRRLSEAKQLGFDVVPYRTVITASYKEIITYMLEEVFKLAEKYKLPQDGVVFKFNDIEYGKSLGNTSHHYRNGIAYKIYNDSVETTLKDIEWSMGKTGILTPVAIFEPVEIEGSIVERASLHNITVMTEIMGGAWNGQKIGVYKANLIIPQVRWAEEVRPNDAEMINIPSICPICGSATKIVKDNDSEVLICINDDCKGKLIGKLSHAVSKNALDVDGLSKATIQKFIDLGWLTSIKDIYHLSNHEKEMSMLEGFGKRSVTKLLDSIEKSRNTSLQRFIYCLSIPLVGESASKDISNEVDGDFDAFMHTLSVYGAEYFMNIPGIGDSIVNSMNDFFRKHCKDMYDLSKEFTFEKPISLATTDDIKSLVGKTFVITGSLEHFENRDAAKAEIELHGGKVSGSVSAKTSYLVNNDIESTSGKNKKAKELGIPIISENQLIAMMR